MIGRCDGAIGASRVPQFATDAPWCMISIAASAPCSCTASAISAIAGMSRSSHSRPSWNGSQSPVGWISVSSVATTAQPPSALIPRSRASVSGWVQPMPVQCGTW